jgi:hypothetical protein
MANYDKNGDLITPAEWETIREETPDEFFEVKGKGVMVIITKAYNGMENNVWELSVYDNNKEEDFIVFKNKELEANAEVERLTSCIENGVDF